MGGDVIVTDRTVDVIFTRLRTKLGKSDIVLRTKQDTDTSSRYNLYSIIK